MGSRRAVRCPSRVFRVRISQKRYFSHLSPTSENQEKTVLYQRPRLLATWDLVKRARTCQRPSDRPFLPTFLATFLPQFKCRKFFKLTACRCCTHRWHLLERYNNNLPSSISTQCQVRINLYTTTIYQHIQ